MKLRVKLVGDPNTVHRVECFDTDTCVALKAAVRLAVFSTSSETEFQLSLNKKDHISEVPGVTVKSLGLCGGDVIWVIGNVPNSLTANTQTPSLSKKPRSEEVSGSVSAASSAMDVDIVQVPVTVQENCTNTGAVSNALATHCIASTQEPEKVPGVTLPDCLQRLMASYPQGTQFTPHQLLLLAVHAAMMETGFSLTGDQGLVLPPVPLSLFNRPLGAPHRLQYTLPNGQDSQHSCSALPRVTVVAVSLGSFLMVHASISDLHPLPAPTTLLSSIQTSPPSGNGAADSGVSPSNVQLPQASAIPKQTSFSLSLSSATHVASQHAAKQHDTHQTGTSTGGSSASYADLRSLWCTLKNSLTLKVLAGVYQTAGLPAPYGLLVLPSEVADCVLQWLPAKALAMVMCSCTQLRHMGSSDGLWKGLMTEFGPAMSSADSESARHRGWAHVYARKAMVKKAQEEARARQRPRPMFNPVPMPRPLPGGPSRYPGIAPGMMIGGDYDRFPLVPGNMLLPGQGMGGGFFRQAAPGVSGGMFGASQSPGLFPAGGRRGSRTNPPGLD